MHRIQSVLEKFWEKEKQTQSSKVTGAKKTETTLQVRRLTLNGTSVPILHKLQGFMLQTAHALVRVPDRLIFASMCNDITDWESQKTSISSERSGYLRSKIQIWLLVFLCSRNGKDLEYNEERPSHQFAHGEWDTLALRIKGNLPPANTKCSSVRALFKQLH